jgi:hypothetical protein
VGYVVGYHGGSKKILDRLLRGDASLVNSTSTPDWLGEGIYFWVGCPHRAARWAITLKQKNKIDDPDVIGAVISIGNCLDMTNPESVKVVQRAYERNIARAAEIGLEKPKNTSDSHGIAMSRKLDCAVIDYVHYMRKHHDQANPYDTVYGVFEEGAPIFTGSSFRELSHAQIAVRNPRCIHHYFRPLRDELNLPQ